MGMYGNASSMPLIVGPSEIISYSDAIINAYEKKNPRVMKSPFVGFKILMNDNDARKGTGEQRMRYLDQHIGKVIGGTGCFLRETNASLMPTGFWLVSMPVPLTQLSDYTAGQMERIMSNVVSLEDVFNMSFMGRVEINVSGRCTVPATERSLKRVFIPKEFEDLSMKCKGSPYTLGNIVRINDEYMVMRTNWNMEKYRGYYDSLGDAMLQLAHNISAMFY